VSNSVKVSYFNLSYDKVGTSDNKTTFVFHTMFSKPNISKELVGKLGCLSAEILVKAGGPPAYGMA
jgi:hypothetical protein